jgi:hypothetical protein
MKNTPKGFALFIIVIVVGVIAIAGTSFYYSKTKQELLNISLNKQEHTINGDLQTIHQATTTGTKTASSTKKVNPNTSTSTNNGTAWRCQYTSQGTLFDPNNPPPTVCGYPPTCPKGLNLIVGRGQGTWADGSLKAMYSCSDSMPPATPR